MRTGASRRVGRVMVSVAALCLGVALCGVASAQETPAAAGNGEQVTRKIPHIEVDVKNKRVTVECAVCKADYALEFFCVTTNGNEYESVLSSDAKPSNLHLALLLIGLKPGAPVQYVEATKTWIAPHGPPLDISCAWQKDGKTVKVPAYRLMRNVKTKKELPAMTWIFAGSRMMPDGNYGADPAGYLVSVLNNELTVIDIPALAGRALETREWEPNKDLLPDAGTKVQMIIEPAAREIDPKFENAPGGPADGESPSPAPAAHAAGDPAGAPAGAPAVSATANPAATQAAGPEMTDAQLQALRDQWEKTVGPNREALRKAAQAHYDTIEALRQEQNRLAARIDRIQRMIDELNKSYDQITTPTPTPTDVQPAPAPQNNPAQGNSTQNSTK